MLKKEKKTTGQYIFVTTSFNLIIKKQSKKQGYNIIVKAQRFKYVILTESYTSKERYVLVNKNNYRTCYTMNWYPNLVIKNVHLTTSQVWGQGQRW